MKTSFIRILWGAFLEEDQEYLHDLEKTHNFKYDPKNKILTRRSKVEIDITKSMEKEFQVPFVTYVFGSKNYEQLVKMGLKCVLIHPEPYLFHPIRGVYLHKLEAHKFIMEDFDEVVILDWDTYLTKSLPENFWDVLGKKAEFQASLSRYKTPKIKHRSSIEANRLVPTGAFLYMRDKSIAQKLIELNKKAPNRWSEEPAFAFLTDEITNGWKGISEYWKLFEPEFYTAKKSPFVRSNGYNKENICFGNGFKK